MTMEQIDANFAIMQELYKDQTKFRALARQNWIGYEGIGTLPHNDLGPGKVKEIGDPSRAPSPYIGYLQTLDSEGPFIGRSKYSEIEGVDLGVERAYNAELNANFDVLWLAIEDGAGNLIKLPVMIGSEKDKNDGGGLILAENGRMTMDHSFDAITDVAKLATDFKKSVGRINTFAKMI